MSANEDVWTEEYTMRHTVRYYSFHNEVFSKLLLFVCICAYVLFWVEACKDTGWIQGDREMSGTGEHDVKLTDNKKLKTDCLCRGLQFCFGNPRKPILRQILLSPSTRVMSVLCGHAFLRRETSGNICFPGCTTNLNLFFGNELKF